LEENIEAWEIWKLASGSPWGMSPSDVIAVMRLVGVEDEIECLVKVMAINGELNKSEGKK
jgi:hypothetical protein